MLLEGRARSAETGDNYHPAFRAVRDVIGRDTKGKNMSFFTSHEVYLLIGDLETVQELYTTYNKIFDKHPVIKNVTMELTGRSILFAETDELWKKRRDAIRPAFYKGKLIEMIETAKDCMRGTLDRWTKKTEQNGDDSAKIDLINEISLMFTRIILKCAIGESLDDYEIDYWVDGVNVRSDVPFSLRNTFQKLLDRQFLPWCALFPYFHTKFIMPFERDILANCKALRALFEHMIKERRDLIKNNPEAAEKKGDLLSILLTDELFSLDNEMIIDECMTFFFAGSQTSSVATQNLVIHLLKNKHYGDKILKEIEEMVVKPHLEE